MNALDQAIESIGREGRARLIRNSAFIAFRRDGVGWRGATDGHSMLLRRTEDPGEPKGPEAACGIAFPVEAPTRQTTVSVPRLRKMCGEDLWVQSRECPQCESEGVIECQSCRGDALHFCNCKFCEVPEECSECLGEGKHECPTCDGEGQTNLPPKARPVELIGYGVDLVCLGRVLSGWTDSTALLEVFGNRGFFRLSTDGIVGIVMQYLIDTSRIRRGEGES